MTPTKEQIEAERGAASEAIMGIRWAMIPVADFDHAAGVIATALATARMEGFAAGQNAATHLTPLALADALDCFWNASLNAARERDDYSAFSTASVVSEGFAAVANRLREAALRHKE